MQTVCCSVKAIMPAKAPTHASKNIELDALASVPVVWIWPCEASTAADSKARSMPKC